MQEPLDLAIDSAGIARLTLNRTRRANSLDAELTAALMAALEQVAENASVRVVVLLANGRTFCAGVDLNWMKKIGAAVFEENYQDALNVAKMLHRLNTMPIPVVAAVTGPVIGLGLGIVACCDVAVAVEGVTFRLSEVRLGILPAVISPYLIAAIGARASRRYFLTAETFDAATAARLGLLHQVCDRDSLGGVIAQIVTEILTGKPLAQRAAKALIEDFRLALISPSLIEDTARRLAEIRHTPEAQKALAEFLGH
jgi:methylglutaconyl-CoA hydratase